MKIRGLLVLVTALSSTAFSAQAETISDALLACGNTGNSLKRLVCYDDVVKNINNYTGTQEAISRTVALAPRANKNVESQQPVKAEPTPPRTSNSEFGLEHKVSLDDLPDSFAGVVSKVTKSPRGYIIITFDNGSIWQQSDDKDLKIKVGQEIMIERGMLGAFYAQKEGVNKRMKVKRVK